MIFERSRLIVILLVCVVIGVVARSSIVGVTCEDVQAECPSSTTATATATAPKSKPLVLMASSTPSKQAELVQWIHDHQSQLQRYNTPLIVQPVIRTALQYHPFIQHKELNVVRTTQGVVLTTTDTKKDMDDDLYASYASSDNGLFVDEVLVARMVLQQQVEGVIYLRDTASSSPSTLTVMSSMASTVVEVACHVANKPIATNAPTADLILGGLVSHQSKKPKAYLLFNPIAGHGNPHDDLDTIRRTLEPFIDLTVIYTQKDRDVASQATEIINIIKASADNIDDDDGDESSKNNKPILIASGGDGTVSAVAGVTMGSGIPFAVIPRGTANAFSVALGIPTSVQEACNNILKGNIRTVDGAYMNDTPMVLLAGIGFEADMVDAANRELKDQIGVLAYIYGGAKTLLDQKTFHCDVTIDGQTYPDTMKMTGITVANVAPPTSVSAMGMGTVEPDDGFLDVSIQVSLNEFSSLANMASLFASAVTQQPTDTDSLLALRAKSIEVSCPESHNVVVDGEMLEAKTMMFKIVDHGLNVVAPPPLSSKTE